MADLPPDTPPVSPVSWDADGLPRSRRFGDVYFSSADGLAESRAVFLAGCGLPQAWAGRRRFTVGELGFGSGLNILALLDLWRAHRPSGARLDIFSVEAFPMPAADARRALSAWPEIADLAGALASHWPRAAPGFHRIDFPGIDATLDLAVMDVAEALEAWDGRADAWFLDGFSPACNPDMWSEAVFQALARRSAPGARAATFTVAGAVRRGLAAAGFEVAKAPGFGRKRQRLEARRPGEPAADPGSAPRVAVVGAGIAGAALARAFSALGVRAQLFEADGPGAGASGNPAALVMPRLDAGGGPIARLYAQAVARAADLYASQPRAILARGVLQLEAGPKDAGRFDRIAADDVFPPDAVTRLDAQAVSGRLGEPAGVGGLLLSEATVIRPAAVLAPWLAQADVHHGRIAALERDGRGWRLLDAEGREAGRPDIVCLAAGLGCRGLWPEAPLSAVRGQVGVVAAWEQPYPAIGGGYLIPTGEGLVFGATHDRDDEGFDARPGDTARNLALLGQVRPALAAALAGTPIEARAAVRAVTPDFLPLAGAAGVAEGLFILSGLGSRGFCAAPLLAEHLAALALGAPSPLPRPLAELVDPQRFEMRRRRRLARSSYT
ncbi:MAG: FAD-dependent 5-carboxymethylaminomethyl-2-thiouridine(34) oxidoreductase MnmC [Caulobacteraceae bacterium]|nr:FAD-dependent 5-carboxymethylaminomethyl-2-thiouridine(34) oxidoreductase MnmC [Caulobacteraceae bacterium]